LAGDGVRHLPRLVRHAANLGAYLRFEANLPQDIFELAIITAAREFDCEFVWVAHAPTAVRVGVPQAIVDAIAARGATDGFPPRYRAVADFARGIVRDHQVTNDSFATMRTEFGERGLTDITALIGFYLLLACALIANDMELPAGRAGFPERAAAG
jgi:4-carboxymuconolactone decarboxylase